MRTVGNSWATTREQGPDYEKFWLFLTTLFPRRSEGTTGLKEFWKVAILTRTKPRDLRYSRRFLSRERQPFPLQYLSTESGQLKLMCKIASEESFYHTQTSWSRLCLTNSSRTQTRGEAVVQFTGRGFFEVS